VEWHKCETMSSNPSTAKSNKQTNKQTPQIIRSSGPGVENIREKGVWGASVPCICFYARTTPWGWWEPMGRPSGGFRDLRGEDTCDLLPHRALRGGVARYHCTEDGGYRRPKRLLLLSTSLYAHEGLHVPRDAMAGMRRPHCLIFSGHPGPDSLGFELVWTMLQFRYEESPQRLMCWRLGPQLMALLRGEWIVRVLASSVSQTTDWTSRRWGLVGGSRVLEACPVKTCLVPVPFLQLALFPVHHEVSRSALCVLCSGSAQAQKRGSQVTMGWSLWDGEQVTFLLLGCLYQVFCHSNRSWLTD
jgi:hypothetical protein